MKPLTEKYRPTCFNEIKSQEIAINEIKNFYKTFPSKRALILNGPVGTGKTSLAIALANENNIELFELNASDLRNRFKLEQILKPSLQQDSLFKKSKLILMDEIDGITSDDKGGLPELIALISKTNFPIILTSNNIWDKKFSLLRQKCKIVSLKELSKETIKEILINVLNKEAKRVKLETLNLIIEQARGDVRAALNDLQSVIDFGEIIEISKREKSENIFDVMKKLFQNKTDNNVVNIFENLNEDLDEILLWIEENLPLEYKNEALEKAFNSISKADIFRGRIYRQQFWRFLIYQNFFLSAGISAVEKLKNNKFVSYKRPSRILKIWLSNQKNQKINAIIEKYAKFCHMSKKKAKKERFLLPFILTNLDKKTKIKMKIEKNDEEFLNEKKNEVIVNLEKYN